MSGNGKHKLLNKIVKDDTTVKMVGVDDDDALVSDQAGVSYIKLTRKTWSK
jgi:hypothetical protein